VSAAQEQAAPPVIGYPGYVRVAFSHAVVMMLRRSRLILAAAIALLPVLLPPALAFLSRTPFAALGDVTFVRMMEDLYVGILAPVLALFFAGMLVGEDVETQTIAYILTRPLPRSAWIVGRFLAYVFLCASLLCVSAALVFAGCRSLANLEFTAAHVLRLLQYCGVLTLAILAYGSLCLFLGTFSKRPIIYGLLLLFGWQRVAMQIPGLVDFLTLQKYLETLYPKSDVARPQDVFEQTALGFQKNAIPIENQDALLTLFIVSVVFVVFPAVAFRIREYTAARAAGE